MRCTYIHTLVRYHRITSVINDWGKWLTLLCVFTVASRPERLFAATTALAHWWAGTDIKTATPLAEAYRTVFRVCGGSECTS